MLGANGHRRPVASRVDRGHSTPATLPLIFAKKRVLKAIRDPESDDGLTLKLLERRQRDRYSPKIIEEHTGEVTLGYGEIESAPKATSPEEATRLASGTYAPGISVCQKLQISVKNTAV